MIIYLKIPSLNYSESDTECNITVTVNDIKELSSLKFIYRANLTAVFKSVDRHRGGTAGGTLLVIDGQRFSKNSSSMRIQLGKSECSTWLASENQIKCYTGAQIFQNTQTAIQIYTEFGFAVIVNLKRKE